MSDDTPATRQDKPGPPAELNRFLDEHGRLKTWPARPRFRRMAMDWMAARFEPGARYSEREVNAILQDLHGFNDHAGLRRALVDHRRLDRTPDGSAYWRRAQEPARTE